MSHRTQTKFLYSHGNDISESGSKSAESINVTDVFLEINLKWLIQVFPGGKETYSVSTID